MIASDGLRCQWGPFAQASFQAVANHSLLLQDSHPQWHNCVQVVCRELASDINKLVSIFKCLREPVGALQAHQFVYSFGLRFYAWTQQGTAEVTRRSGCTLLVPLCSRNHYSPPLQPQGARKTCRFWCQFSLKMLNFFIFPETREAHSCKS